MSLSSLMRDRVYIVSPDGEKTGPVRALVQKDKVLIDKISLKIEEGGKILRQLPSEIEESFKIIQVNYNEAPVKSMSHYSIEVEKDSLFTNLKSKQKSPSRTVYNIHNSQGIQIGDGNIQNIVSSLSTLIESINASDSTLEEKTEVKEKLKALLMHPLVVALLGSASGELIKFL